MANDSRVDKQEMRGVVERVMVDDVIVAEIAAAWSLFHDALIEDDNVLERLVA
jgi:hypothetical protein